MKGEDRKSMRGREREHKLWQGMVVVEGKEASHLQLQLIIVLTGIQTRGPLLI